MGKKRKKSKVPGENRKNKKQTGEKPDTSQQTPAKKNRMSKLASVHRGVSYVYYGLYLIVASILVMMFGAAFVMVSPAIGLMAIAAVPIMIIAGTILGLVGRIMCLSVPEDFSAAGLIYAAVICDVVVVMISSARWIVVLPELASTLSPLLSLAATILFLVFLKMIAAYVDDSISERRAGNVLNLLIATFVAALVGMFLPPLLIVAVLMGLVGFITYVLLLMSLMKSLKTV